MTEKRFRVHELVKYDYSEIKEYVGEGYTDKPLRNDELCRILNELYDKNKELKEQLKDCIIKTKEEFRKESENDTI